MIICLTSDETERYHAELVKVREELEPWETQLIEHKGKLDVAVAESNMLKEKVCMQFVVCRFILKVEIYLSGYLSVFSAI